MRTAALAQEQEAGQLHDISRHPNGKGSQKSVLANDAHLHEYKLLGISSGVRSSSIMSASGKSAPANQVPM
jgi:hypothetical protein